MATVAVPLRRGVAPSEGPTEPASAALEVRGLCDDSVDGIWYEITIEGDDQFGWVAATATKQYICGRGVAGEVCV